MLGKVFLYAKGPSVCFPPTLTYRENVSITMALQVTSLVPLLHSLQWQISHGPGPDIQPIHPFMVLVPLIPTFCNFSITKLQPLQLLNRPKKQHLTCADVSSYGHQNLNGHFLKSFSQQWDFQWKFKTILIVQ